MTLANFRLIFVEIVMPLSMYFEVAVMTPFLHRHVMLACSRINGWNCIACFQRYLIRVISARIAL